MSSTPTLEDTLQTILRLMKPRFRRHCEQKIRKATSYLYLTQNPIYIDNPNIKVFWKEIYNELFFHRKNHPTIQWLTALYFKYCGDPHNSSPFFVSFDKLHGRKSFSDVWLPGGMAILLHIWHKSLHPPIARLPLELIRMICEFI